MTPPAKQPNQLLGELIAEAGLSRKALARRVVVRGRAVGLSLSYDHNSVRRWLDGEQPQDPVPDLIAAVLTEGVGRQVLPHHCGLAASAGAPISGSSSVSPGSTAWNRQRRCGAVTSNDGVTSASCRTRSPPIPSRRCDG